MAEYIDRESLIAWLKHIPLRDLSDGNGLCRVIMEDDFKKAIKKMPKGIIADVVPVAHGRWIKEKNLEDFDSMKCTACNGLLLVRWHTCLDFFRYCPNCGAKMDLEEPNDAE